DEVAHDPAQLDRDHLTFFEREELVGRPQAPERGADHAQRERDRGRVDAEPALEGLCCQYVLHDFSSRRPSLPSHRKPGSRRQAARGARPTRPNVSWSTKSTWRSGAAPRKRWAKLAIWARNSSTSPPESIRENSSGSPSVIR